MHVDTKSASRCCPDPLLRLRIPGQFSEFAVALRIRIRDSLAHQIGTVKGSE
jgi:hypothetical protein